MLGADLAALYGVSTKALNHAVKRNIKRFPEDFMFQLTPEEKQEVVTVGAPPLHAQVFQLFAICLNRTTSLTFASGVRLAALCKAHDSKASMWSGLLGALLVMRTVPVNDLPNHFLIRSMMLLCLFLEEVNARLFREIVTLTFSSFNTNWSGGGRKSLMTLNLPIGSSLYFILLFIYFPPFSPITRSINADNITPMREPHGHNAVSDTSNTIKSIFLAAMVDILGYDTVRVKKGAGPVKKRLRVLPDFPCLSPHPIRSGSFSWT